MLDKLEIKSRKAIKTMQTYIPGKPIWEIQKEMSRLPRRLLDVNYSTLVSAN